MTIVGIQAIGYPSSYYTTLPQSYISTILIIIIISLSGADKSTQTQTGAPAQTSPSAPTPATDPSVFCNALCTMLLDRIKDTLQEAMKSYSTDTVCEEFYEGVCDDSFYEGATLFVMICFMKEQYCL
eukprot:sb/3475500/